jgi:hypothetical protein
MTIIAVQMMRDYSIFSLSCGTSLVFLNVKIFICGVDNLNLMLYDIDINDILQKKRGFGFDRRL